MLSEVAQNHTAVISISDKPNESVAKEVRPKWILQSHGCPGLHNSSFQSAARFPIPVDYYLFAHRKFIFLR